MNNHNSTNFTLTLFPISPSFQRMPINIYINMASRFVLLSTIKYTLTLGLGTDFSVCDLSFKSVAPHLPVDRLYFLLIILTIFYCYMFVCVSVFILLFFCDSYYFSGILVFCFAVYNLLFSRFHNLLFRKKKLGLNVSVNLIFLFQIIFSKRVEKFLRVCVFLYVCVCPSVSVPLRFRHRESTRSPMDAGCRVFKSN